MATIGNVVKAIFRNPAPVLFLDTCVLLDIVRAPGRNKPNEVRVGQVLLTALRKTPRTIHLLVGSPTRTEWNDHIAATVGECTTAIHGANAISTISGYLALPAVSHFLQVYSGCRLCSNNFRVIS